MNSKVEVTFVCCDIFRSATDSIIWDWIENEVGKFFLYLVTLSEVVLSIIFTMVNYQL